MSQTGRRNVLQHALTDEQFLARFRADPEAVLDEFDLTDEERDVFLSGDETRLHDLQANGLVLRITVKPD